MQRKWLKHTSSMEDDILFAVIDDKSNAYNFLFIFETILTCPPITDFRIEADTENVIFSFTLL